VATIGDLAGKLAGPESPWLLFVAGVLLLAAAGIGRRLMSSLQRIGARVGELERVSESERTRRRQVEAELAELGVPLPYWPPDGPHAPRTRRPAPDLDDAEDLDDEEPAPAPETAVNRVPVPPLPPAERAIAARHRR
jgi:hypothetical protein